MNRTIKFRGKTFHDEWVYGVPVPSADRKMWAIFDNFNDLLEPFDKVTVRPETIGQYTGLKDVDGKEIYEGDIISDGLGTNGTVFYNFYEGSYLVAWHNCKVTHIYSDYTTRTIHVVGNIHE